MSPDIIPLDWPLMSNNITRDDLDGLVAFLRDGNPILTQSTNVRAFEQEWSKWLGCKYSVFVNSGASANLLTMAALRESFGGGEIIVPTLTWVSDIASVLQTGFKPVFVDIDPRTLGMDTDELLGKITSDTRAVFLTHILGYNALDQLLLDELHARKIPLIEDVCESHGATFNGRRLGSFGLASNFSFYYAHHLSTIEGGMICTDDERLYQTLRMLRSHGMVRETTNDAVKQDYLKNFPDLNPDFIFSSPAYNVRSTEINAVLGRNQLKRLDANIDTRNANLHHFLAGLNPELYCTDFKTEGCSNYAFTLVLKEPDIELRDRVEAALRANKVEFRRGTSGGGNQLRQPYLRRLYGDHYLDFPKVNHVHFFGWYIGNYPDLDRAKIGKLCEILNGLGRPESSRGDDTAFTETLVCTEP
jgi:CDP-6-deoxy-D-xylo-4-hexulose-3-dehydrase